MVFGLIANFWFALLAYKMKRATECALKILQKTAIV